jgi:hypothetical protein
MVLRNQSTASLLAWGLRLREMTYPPMSVGDSYCMRLVGKYCKNDNLHRTPTLMQSR